MAWRSSDTDNLAPNDTMTFGVPSERRCTTMSKVGLPAEAQPG